MLIICLIWNEVSASSNSSNSALSSDSTRSNALRRILFSFSWRRNFAILFSEQPKNCISDVIEIAGLRVLCLLWILLVHICTVLYYVAGEFNYIMIIMISRVHCAIEFNDCVIFVNHLSAHRLFHKYLALKIWVLLVFVLGGVNKTSKTNGNQHKQRMSPSIKVIPFDSITNI